MISNYVRSCVRAIPAYTPGEQPLDLSVVKLNTNESPYPPPFDLKSTVLAETDRLRLYPPPTCPAVIAAASAAFGIAKEGIVVGNGSDELLLLMLRTFVDPGDLVAAPSQTYSLYEVIAKQHGAEFYQLPMTEEFDLEEPVDLPKQTKLLFLASPNPPRGNLLRQELIADLCNKIKGIVVVDEAYVDFAPNNALPLLAQFDNLVITRTLSKGYSLAGLRVGLALTNETLAAYLQGVRDSYSVDRLAQAIAAQAIKHREDYKPLWKKICETRERLKGLLELEDCFVLQSDANFLLCAPSFCSAQELFHGLQQEKILVRYFDKLPGMEDYVRITIGTAEEVDILLASVRRLRNKFHGRAS